MVDYETRRLNFRRLLDRTYGVHAIGAQTRAAEKLGRTPTLISRCLSPPCKQGSKSIDDDLARQIEVAFALPGNALDEPELGEADGPVKCEPIAAQRPPAGVADDCLLAAERATLVEINKLCESILNGLPPDMQAAVSEGAEGVVIPVPASHLRMLMELVRRTERVPTRT